MLSEEQKLIGLMASNIFCGIKMVESTTKTKSSDSAIAQEAIKIAQSMLVQIKTISQ